MTTDLDTDATNRTPPSTAATGDEAAAAEHASGVDIRAAFYTLGLVTLIVAILWLAANPLAPISLAILIWFLINAIATGIRSAPGLGPAIPEWLALTAASVLTLGGMFFAGQLVVQNFAELGEGLVGFDDKAAAALASVEAFLGVDFGFDVKQAIDEFKITDITNEFFRTIVDLISATASNLATVLLFVLFLMFDQPFYNAKIRALFPNPSRRERVRSVLARIGRDTRTYVWLMTVVSILVGVFTYAICEFFALKGAIFWGFLAFALNYIPTLGSFAGVLFPAAFAFVQFDDLQHTLIFVASLAIVQFIMGNLLLPRWTGGRLNLSEFVVVLSLIVWGALWGVAGMFLAVPLMMVLAIVLAQFDSTRPVAILLSKNGRVGPEK